MNQENVYDAIIVGTGISSGRGLYDLIKLREPFIDLYGYGPVRRSSSKQVNFHRSFLNLRDGNDKKINNINRPPYV